MELSAWLERSPLVAILRGVRPDEVEAIVDVLEEEGIGIAEVPLNSPDPLDSIGRLARRFGERLLIGAGTVRRPDEVGRIADCGGRLIVMPHADVGVVRAAKAAGLLAAPGFLSPTEAFAAIDAGADALKLFPAEAVSPAVLGAMRAVLPAAMPIIPVGGMAAGKLLPWRRAGAAGFGIGSAIYKPGDGPAEVRAKARGLVASLNEEAALA
jgi:2-dehydro-3-deoxyphosphogalactonate aldolase